MKCPYCGYDAKKMKECYATDSRRRDEYYVCMNCGSQLKRVIDGEKEMIVVVSSPKDCLLLKGSIENFLYSLRDFVERRSELIRQFPAGIFLWGTSQVDRRIKAGVNVFLYVTKNQYNEGGLALYGHVFDVRKFSGRYWPSGKWRYLFPIKVEKAAEGVIENPNDPTKWRLPDRQQLEKLGVKILPGIRTVKLEQAEKLKELLKPLR